MLSGTIIRLVSFKGELLTVGGFSSAGTTVSYRFARWSNTGIPWIAEPPLNVTVSCDPIATFTVLPASGYGDLSYQWRRNGQLIDDGQTKHASTISGANTPALSITNPHVNDQGDYDCMITNDCGVVISLPAVFTINRCGDLNGDGMVGVPDLLAVINAWGACSEPCPPSCPADISPESGDCNVRVPDLLFIINNWG